MLWLYLLIPLAIVIGIAVYVEKRSRKKANKAGLTMKEKEDLEEDYIKRGAHNETEDPRNL